MDRRNFLAASTAASLLPTTFARAQTPIAIKFSHVVATDTPKGQAAERFKALAEQRLAADGPRCRRVPV